MSELLVRTKMPLEEKNLSKILDILGGDDVIPVRFLCLRCKLKWDTMDGCSYPWYQTTCSNCYADPKLVRVIKVEVDFYNWGEQNGGETERLQRLQEAKHIVRQGVIWKLFERKSKKNEEGLVENSKSRRRT